MCCTSDAHNELEFKFKANTTTYDNNSFVSAFIKDDRVYFTRRDVEYVLVEDMGAVGLIHFTLKRRRNICCAPRMEID